jgi:hypothetical protein
MKRTNQKVARKSSTPKVQAQSTSSQVPNPNHSGQPSTDLVESGLKSLAGLVDQYAHLFQEDDEILAFNILAFIHPDEKKRKAYGKISVHKSGLEAVHTEVIDALGSKARHIGTPAIKALVQTGKVHAKNYARIANLTPKLIRELLGKVSQEQVPGYVCPFDRIYDHVARTLPDGLVERKSLLQAIHNVITDEHPIKPAVAAQIAAIDSITSLGNEFISTIRGEVTQKQAPGPVSFDKIYEHVARSLPDDLVERKSLLQAIHNVITDEHPIKPTVAAQIAAIDSIQALEADLLSESARV